MVGKLSPPAGGSLSNHKKKRTHLCNTFWHQFPVIPSAAEGSRSPSVTVIKKEPVQCVTLRLHRERAFDFKVYSPVPVGRYRPGFQQCEKTVLRVENPDCC